MATTTLNLKRLQQEFVVGGFTEGKGSVACPINKPALLFFPIETIRRQPRLVAGPVDRRAHVSAVGCRVFKPPVPRLKACREGRGSIRREQFNQHTGPTPPTCFPQHLTLNTA